MIEAAWSAILSYDAEQPRLADTWVPFMLFLATYWIGGLACALSAAQTQENPTPRVPTRFLVPTRCAATADLLIDLKLFAPIKCQPGKYMSWPMVRST